MSSSSFPVLLALLGMGVLWNAGSASANEQQTLFALNEVERVDLSLAVGNVWISDSQEDTALVKLAGHLDSTVCETQVKLDQNTLQIMHHPRVEASDDRDACKVDVIIEVAANAAIRSVIGRGDLAVRGMRGYLSYDIGAGDVRMRDSAPEYIEGNTGVGDVFIRADALGGGNLEIATGAAEVRLAHAPLSGRLQVRVASGDAVVYLPRDIRLKAFSDSKFGSFTSEFPQTSNTGFEVGGSVMTGHMSIKKF